MIQRRASLTKDMTFESGTKLKQGTMVYVEETEHGAIASHYNDKGSASCFIVGPEEYSVWVRGDTPIEDLVVEEDPPEPTEETLKRRELVQRRLRSKIKQLREEADRIENLLEREAP